MSDAVLKEKRARNVDLNGRRYESKGARWAFRASRGQFGSLLLLCETRPNPRREDLINLQAQVRARSRSAVASIREIPNGRGDDTTYYGRNAIRKRLPKEATSARYQDAEIMTCGIAEFGPRPAQLGLLAGLLGLP